MAATDANLGLVFGTDSATAPFLHYFAHDYVSGVLHDARNNNAKVLSLIPENKKYVGGRHIRERVKYGRNPNQFNGVGDDGEFPDPGQRKAAWYAYRSRQSMARFIIGGKLVRATSAAGSADLDPLMDDLDSFMDDWLLDKARQMYSDGSGRLCEIAETGSAATSQQFTLRINQDVGTGLGAPGASVSGMADEPPTRWLTAGMRVLIISAAGVPKCVATVTSVDDSTQATLAYVASASGTQFSDAGGGVAVGDWVVKTGNANVTSAARMRANSAFKAEQMGLLGILGYGGPIDGTGRAAEVGADWPAGNIEGGASGAEGAWQWGGTDAFLSTSTDYFQGLACKSSGAGWNSELAFNQGMTDHNSGTLRTPTENLFMKVLDNVETLNSAEIDIWLSGYEIRHVYFQQLTGEKRFMNTLELKGGWKRTAVGPGGVPWAVDRLMLHNTCLGLSLQDGGFQQWVTEELSWATEQGANIWQYLQDQDKYQARLVEEGQIGVGVRNRCGIRIMDLEES